MRELPSGTVTFLFTDIEGSTRLWERAPEAMRAAVARHDELVGSAVQAHHGSLYKHVGDSVQAAFFTPTDALSTAVAAQRALANERWAETGPLQVRMALHLGEAVPTPEGDYHQVACLNRLARLLAAGHGGQILLTEVVRYQLDSSLPAAVSLKDLGKHRLRDLLEPERISQVVIPGLPDHFPPLKSLEGHPTNLPIQPTPLVGREAELVAVSDLLVRDDARLVTLTGVGGTGKTRLALQVAADLLDHFEDGAFFVDLAPLADPALVLPTIAATLGIREAGGQSLRDTLIAYLAGKHLLLLLDNFEHLLAASSVVAELLAACAELKVLATSRAPLHVRAEQEFPVPPMALPDPLRLPALDRLAEVAAVTLFVQRAQASKPDFALTAENGAAVAELCVRLDGLPLAIELAAARIKLLPPRPLLAHLERRLPLLVGGPRDLPARQRTLRDTIAWSYDLLSSEEQTLFRRVAIFVGGCTLEAVEAVANPDQELDVFTGLAALVDHSLVRYAERPDGEPRFSILETVREYGLERLAASDEETAVRERHASYCLILAEALRPRIDGPDGAVAVERFETEHNNLRAALAWSIAPGKAETGLRLVNALWKFWYVHNHLGEGRAWLEHAVQQAGTSYPGPRAEALYAIASFARSQGDFEQAVATSEEGLALARQAHDPLRTAMLLFMLGVVALDQGDLAKARTWHEEAVPLFRALRATLPYAAHMLAMALAYLGDVVAEQGDPEAATVVLEEALEIWRARGDQWGIANALLGLGNVARARGDLARAVTLHQESLTAYWDLRDRARVIDCLEHLAWLGAMERQAELAARLVGVVEALRETLGIPLPPKERPDHEDTVAVVQAALGEEAFAHARAAGRVLPLEQAVAEALTSKVRPAMSEATASGKTAD